MRRRFSSNRSTSRTSTRPTPPATARWQASWHRSRCSPAGIRTITGSLSAGPSYIPKVFNGKNKLFWFFSYLGEQDSPAGPVQRNHQYGSHHGGAAGQLLGPAEHQFEIPDLRSAERGGRPGPARALHPDADSGKHHSPKQNSAIPRSSTGTPAGSRLPTTTRPVPAQSRSTTSSPWARPTTSTTPAWPAGETGRPT